MPPSPAAAARPLLLLAAVALAACGGAEEERPAPSSEEPAVAAAAPPASPEENTIRPDGIGPVRPGMTITGLRAALPVGTTLGAAEPFMVDVSGIPLVRGTDTLLHVLVLSGEPAGDDAPITWVATRNPVFRTAEGVGPGMRIAEAVAKYGAPTLSYSTDDESREYVAFAGFRQPSIRFRTAAAGDAMHAGVYATEGEYNETSEFAPDARIGLVMVETGRPGTD